MHYIRHVTLDLSKTTVAKRRPTVQDLIQRFNEVNKPSFVFRIVGMCKRGACFQEWQWHTCLVHQSELFKYDNGKCEMMGCFKWCQGLFLKQWGSKRTLEMPPSWPSFLHFHALFGKKVYQIIGWCFTLGNLGSAIVKDTCHKRTAKK